MLIKKFMLNDITKRIFCSCFFNFVPAFWQNTHFFTTMSANRQKKLATYLQKWHKAYIQSELQETCSVLKEFVENVIYATVLVSKVKGTATTAGRFISGMSVSTDSKVHF